MGTAKIIYFRSTADEIAQDVGRQKGASPSGRWDGLQTETIRMCFLAKMREREGLMELHVGCKRLDIEQPGYSSTRENTEPFDRFARIFDEVMSPICLGKSEPRDPRGPVMYKLTENVSLGIFTVRGYDLHISLSGRRLSDAGVCYATGSLPDDDLRNRLICQHFAETAIEWRANEKAYLADIEKGIAENKIEEVRRVTALGIVECKMSEAGIDYTHKDSDGETEVTVRTTGKRLKASIRYDSAAADVDKFILLVNMAKEMEGSGLDDFEIEDTRPTNAKFGC